MEFLAVTVIALMLTVAQSDLLYPWGANNDDIGGPTAKGVYPIPMNKKIRFFRQSHWNISLCSRGRIGFEPLSKVNMYYPEDFDCGNANIVPFGVLQNLGPSGKFGAPFDYMYQFWNFWDEYSTLPSEHLWYRTTHNRSLLKTARDDILNNFPSCHRNFKPKELFIATWTAVHDIDFCELKGYNEEMCKCVMDSPYINEYPLGYLGAADPTLAYCDCLLNAEHTEACLCQAYDDHSSYAVFGDMVKNMSLCVCLWHNDLKFCDCQIYGNCDSSARSIFKRDKQETNTYQVVLITDGKQTYAMFNYQTINWIYINTDGYKTNKLEWYGDPLRIYAMVGFEKEAGKAYYHPYSESDDLYQLASNSNVGKPGRWMYKISGRRIQGSDCVNLPFTK